MQFQCLFQLPSITPTPKLYPFIATETETTIAIPPLFRTFTPRQYGLNFDYTQLETLNKPAFFKLIFRYAIYKNAN